MDIIVYLSTFTHTWINQRPNVFIRVFANLNIRWQSPNSIVCVRVGFEKRPTQTSVWRTRIWFICPFFFVADCHRNHKFIEINLITSMLHCACVRSRALPVQCIRSYTSPPHIVYGKWIVCSTNFIQLPSTRII